MLTRRKYQVSILFLSTSPSSPFIHSPTPSQSPDATHTNATLPLSSPIPGRPWFNLYGGSLFDPPLVGYREINKIIRGDVKPEPEPEPEPVVEEEKKLPRWYDYILHPPFLKSREDLESLRKTPPPTPSPTPTPNVLPAGFVDLRYKGLGFVVDFGWKRSEEGMAWELEEYRRSRVDPLRVSVDKEPKTETRWQLRKRMRDGFVYWRDRVPGCWDRIALLRSW